MAAKPNKSKRKKKGLSLKPDFSGEAFFKALKGLDNACFEQLPAVNIGQTIVLVGEEPLRLQRLVKTIQTTFGIDVDSHDVFYGQELSNKRAVDDLCLSVHNMSLFASESLVTVFSGDAIRAAYAEKIAKSLADSHPSSLVLVTLSQQNADCQLLKYLPRDRYTLVDIPALNEAKLIRWIQHEAKTHDVAMEPRAAQLLAKYFDHDLYHLSHEVQRLALLVSLGEAITEEMVRENSSLSAEHTTFQLVQTIAAHQPLQAVQLTDSLLAENVHPLQITALLHRCFRMMLAEKNTGDISLPPELTNYYFKKNLGSASRRFKASELATGLESLAALDLSLKSSGIPDHEALHATVISLAQPQH